jgi:hypothetical protein
LINKVEADTLYNSLAQQEVDKLLSVFAVELGKHNCQLGSVDIHVGQEEVELGLSPLFLGMVQC